MSKVDWSRYAQCYDLMCGINPAYQDLLARFDHFLAELPTTCGTLVDYGAGTGNFSARAYATKKFSRVIHVDSNQAMNELARMKAGADGFEVLNRDLDVFSGEMPQADVVVSVHALYTLKDPAGFLKRMASSLRPGGRSFLCDLGRPMDVADWRRYLVRDSLKRRGIVKTAGIVMRGRMIARQNRHIAAEQMAGRYWMHTPEEFRKTVEDSGLSVLHQMEVYRGCSDLVIVEKPS